MRIYRERLFTEEELGNLEQREYGLLRKVKATIGRARRNVAKKIEDKIDKNLSKFDRAEREIKRSEYRKAPKGSYRAVEQIRKDVRKEQPDVYITNKTRKRGANGAFYWGRDDGGFYVNRKNIYSKEAEKVLGIPEYANHMIFNGKNPDVGTTLHEVEHMRRATGKEGAIANFISKKSMSKELNPENLPMNQILLSHGIKIGGNRSINRGGIVNNVKDISRYVSKWLEERAANKYANKELKRLLKEGKISKEIYDRGIEGTKLSMDAYTPATKVNILSSIKNTIDIPSRRGRFDLARFKND